jgi:hypothetical protein
LASSARAPIGLFLLGSCCKYSGPRRHFILNLLTQTCKKLTYRLLKYYFKRQRSLETRVAGKPFVPADLARAFSPDQKGNVALRKSKALSVRQQIVWKLRRSHVSEEGELKAASSELQNIGLAELAKEAIFAVSGKIS